MIVLGFDTATPATAVGLSLPDGRVLQARDDPAVGQRPGHSTRLLALADGLLAEAALDWGQLERIAVGVGPGTFTGLRIGIATARGLAQSSGVPLVGVSSLRALAHGAATLPQKRFVGTGQTYSGLDGSAGTISGVERGVGVLAAIDARRGEVFVAAFDGEREALGPRAVSPPALEDLVERAKIAVGVERWIAVGDGAELNRDAFERAGALVARDPELHRIQGRSLCALGERAEQDGEAVVPEYCRRPDAEIALEGAS